jgi:hypothetical protein
VLSYLRQYNNDIVLVVLNMSATKQQPAFDLFKQGLASAQANTMLASGASAPTGTLKTVTLEPYGVYIAKLTTK